MSVLFMSVLFMSVVVAPLMTLPSSIQSRYIVDVSLASADRVLMPSGSTLGTNGGTCCTVLKVVPEVSHMAGAPTPNLPPAVRSRHGAPAGPAGPRAPIPSWTAVVAECGVHQTATTPRAARRSYRGHQRFFVLVVLHRLDERFDLYGQRRIPSADLAYAVPRSDVPDRQEPEAEGETVRCVSRRSRRPDPSDPCWGPSHNGTSRGT